jgi:hypothetical protein
MIYHEALPKGQNIKLRLVDEQQPFRGEFIDLPLLRTCRASREAVLEKYQLRFETTMPSPILFCPAKDTILVPRTFLSKNLFLDSVLLYLIINLEQEAGSVVVEEVKLYISQFTHQLENNELWSQPIGICQNLVKHIMNIQTRKSHTTQNIGAPQLCRQ